MQRFLQLPREVLPAAARTAGRNIGNTLVIVDLKGFGYVAPVYCPYCIYSEIMQAEPVLASQGARKRLLPNIPRLLS